MRYFHDHQVLDFEKIKVPHEVLHNHMIMHNAGEKFIVEAYREKPLLTFGSSIGQSKESFKKLVFFEILKKRKVFNLEILDTIWVQKKLLGKQF